MYEIKTITGPETTVATFTNEADAQVFYWEIGGLWIDSNGKTQAIGIWVTGENAIGRIEPDGWYRGHVWAMEKEEAFA